MNPSLTNLKPSIRSRCQRAAQRAASAVALAGFFVSWSDWPVMLREAGTSNWQVAARLAALAGGAFLFLTAAVHWRGAALSRAAATALLVTDLLVAMTAGWVLFRAAESRSLLVGLGGLMPSLLTVASVSCCVTLLSWAVSVRRSAENRPALRSRLSIGLDILRALAAAIAIAAIISLELRSLPRAKPWVSNAQAAAHYRARTAFTGASSDFSGSFSRMFSST